VLIAGDIELDDLEEVYGTLFILNMANQNVARPELEPCPPIVLSPSEDLEDGDTSYLECVSGCLMLY